MAPVTKDQTKDDGQKKAKWSLNIRTLALSQPTRITPKYKPSSPPKHIVSKYALKAKATPRLIALAEPPKCKQRKKFDPTKESKQATSVSRAALKAKCSRRLEMLARNPLPRLLVKYEIYKDRGDYFQRTMKKYIELAKASMYNEMYWPKPPPPPEAPPKLFGCQYWTPPCPPPRSSIPLHELEEWCKLRSTPKPIYPPEPLPPSKKKPMSELKKRLGVLATPTQIRPKYDPVKADHYDTGVSKSALSYQASERVKEIAKPKPIKNPKPNPEGVRKSALNYTASARIVEISKPHVRPQGINEEKENPYAVSPNALRYRCTERIKEIAKPHKRK